MTGQTYTSAMLFIEIRPSSARLDPRPDLAACHLSEAGDPTAAQATWESPPRPDPTLLSDI